MSGEEIYKALMSYMDTLPLPDYIQKEFQEARSLGITDGTHPTQFIPMWRAAVMAKRAYEKGLKERCSCHGEKQDSNSLQGEPE